MWHWGLRMEGSVYLATKSQGCESGTPASTDVLILGVFYRLPSNKCYRTVTTKEVEVEEN